MSDTVHVLEYKCPCCGAGLTFGQEQQKMTCEYCDNSFDLETVQEFNGASTEYSDRFIQDEVSTAQWSEEEQESLNCFNCPACGGQIVTEEHTAATFCPFCDNPAILPGRLSGGLKPDAVIPFSTGKEDAKKAFQELCKGKPLLPKGYADENRLEKITGIYVPFWLYNCDGTQDANYRATRIHRWSDSRYIYTRTDHFMLKRAARAQFQHIPMDGSSKLSDAVMESIEPFDYTKMVPFDTAYLSGYFADKYDVASQDGHQRIKDRVGNTIDQLIAPSMVGYATTIPVGKHLEVHNHEAKYVLLPVWFLHTKYKDRDYVFAMNGQSGKMTGTFPVCPKRSLGWFASICAAVTALACVIQWLAF